MCCVTGLYKIPEVYFFGKTDSVLSVLLRKINHKGKDIKWEGEVLKFTLSMTVGMCVGENQKLVKVIINVDVLLIKQADRPIKIK